MQQQLLSLEAPDPDGIAVATLTPLNIIRTETVLTKLPVHNLSKKGRVDIRIARRTDGGEVRLKWEVSHSDRYGQPRQLAYKLDTLIVNRRLDESVRPLPTLIRIGSLKEISRELGMQESGKNAKDLRMAFLQNASAFINAQLSYSGTDGTERRLEAGFTRYGVVFTGENLPDGRKADAVYITLNQPYHEVLNNAPVRPLNYDYLQALTPAAQRFYEVVSFRIFAALKNNRPQARFLYSDYCTFSAQQRYYDHEHFRVQMYKVHKPHLASGYLQTISVSATTDGEGKPDWMMVYTPGPKASAEFDTFSRRQRSLFSDSGTDEQDTTPATRELSATAGGDAFVPVLEALVQRGISPVRARRLLAGVDAHQRLEDQLEWADTVVRAAKPGAFRNPPGFYVSVIRDNVPVPAGFETSRMRRLCNDARRAQEEQVAEEQRFEQLYDEYRRQELAQRLAATPEAEFLAIRAKKRREYQRQFRDLPGQTLDDLGHSGACAEIEKTLHLRSFGEFTAALRAGQKVPQGPAVP